MLKKLLISIFLVTTTQIFADPSTIKAIFVDVNVLFETNALKAMKYVDTWDATKYTFQMKHKPSQADLFKRLENTPAQSTAVTYNDDLKMPLIFSDWLLNIESASNLESKMIQFLQISNILDIEKKVLGYIVKMMLNPTSLVDTQRAISFAIDMITTLKSKGYKIYIVGNWSNSKALLQGFKEVFIHAAGTMFSGDIHKLKPEIDFYETVMQQAHVNKDSCIWVEKEAKFINKEKTLGYKTVNAESKKSMLQEFKALGINL